MARVFAVIHHNNGYFIRVQESLDATLNLDIILLDELTRCFFDVITELYKSRSSVIEQKFANNLKQAFFVKYTDDLSHDITLGRY